jgi:hypothetical protein
MLTKRYILATFLALSIAAPAFSQSQQAPAGANQVTPPIAQKNTKPTDSHNANSTTRNNSSTAPIRIDTAPSNPLYVKTACDNQEHNADCDKGWWQKFWADPNAMFAGAVALFTFALGVIGWRGLSLNNKEIKLARAEFIATHRPKIRVRFIQYQGPNEGVWSAFLTTSNVGDTDATIVAMGADIGRRNVGDKQWHPPGIAASADGHPPPPDPVLKCGQRRTDTIISTGQITSVDIDNVYEGRMNICAVGEIRYRDENGALRLTGFYWIFNPKTFNFEKVEDPEYSFED